MSTTLDTTLDKIKPIECACGSCVSMCERRPCWGTPQDIENLLDMGLGGSMWLDYWVGGGGDDGYEDIMIISPAMVGCEGERAPYWPSDLPCALLKDGKCTVHKMKPTEGKLAIHAGHPDEFKGDTGLHELVAMTWNTDHGRRIVDRWQRDHSTD